MLEQLQALHREQLFTDLDLHFARLMARLAGAAVPELVLGACLASRWTGAGHVCVDLPRLAGKPLAGAGGGAALQAPALERWLDALWASPVVGRPGEFRPLVLDQRGRLYLYRYWDYERQLAEDLQQRAAAVPDEASDDRLGEDLARLFPDPGGAETDWQKVAAATAALRRLCVITGGPGTGKTTTVIRLLALLIRQAGGRPPRIGLAAPTGKAAARMQEAIRLAREGLALGPEVREAIPQEASTLHRLLGARPDSVYFRHDRNNPLPLDVLVVDEASMVDLALMAKTVAALPPRSRLVLLGDQDQLASVEAGAVLGDICGGVPGFSAPFRTRLEAVTGERIPASAPARLPLGDCVVLLRHSYRFGAASGIGSLAQAVRQGEGASALELAASGRFPDLAWQALPPAAGLPARLAEGIVGGFAPYLQGVRAGAAAAEAIAAFGGFRVLCALRGAATGVEAMNRAIEDILRVRRLIPHARQGWYPGRPVMVTRNDYGLRLFNGDVGLALPDPEAGGQLRVFFQAGDGVLRRFAPARLPEHETVYAMTVHKSQGSEFERVLLVLPGVASEILTRELVYTGVTRARRSVEIWGDAATLEAAVARRLRRSSGLSEALWGEEP